MCMQTIMILREHAISAGANVALNFVVLLLERRVQWGSKKKIFFFFVRFINKLPLIYAEKKFQSYYNLLDFLRLWKAHVNQKAPWMEAPCYRLVQYLENNCRNALNH